MSDKVVLTCALTGAVTTKRQCAAIPYSAEEMGEEARRAWEAGCAVVHVHRRACGARRRFPFEERIAARGVLMHVGDLHRTYAHGRRGHVVRY